MTTTESRFAESGAPTDDAIEGELDADRFVFLRAATSYLTEDEQAPGPLDEQQHARAEPVGWEAPPAAAPETRAVPPVVAARPARRAHRKRRADGPVRRPPLAGLAALGAVLLAAVGVAVLAPRQSTQLRPVGPVATTLPTVAPEALDPVPPPADAAAPAPGPAAGVAGTTTVVTAPPPPVTAPSRVRPPTTVATAGAAEATTTTGFPSPSTTASTFPSTQPTTTPSTQPTTTAPSTSSTAPATTTTTPSTTSSSTTPTTSA